MSDRSPGEKRLTYERLQGDVPLQLTPMPEIDGGMTATDGSTLDLLELMPVEPAMPRALTCYLVEDSPVIRQNLVATLEEMLSVRMIGTAEDEAGAIRWLETDPQPCDLMVIDIFLRSGTGLEVLRRARQLRPDCQLVMLTNYATPDMRRRCEQLGANRVFDKSAELDDLLAYCEALSAAPQT